MKPDRVSQQTLWSVWIHCGGAGGWPEKYIIFFDKIGGNGRQMCPKSEDGAKHIKPQQSAGSTKLIILTHGSCADWPACCCFVCASVCSCDIRECETKPGKILCFLVQICFWSNVTHTIYQLFIRQSINKLTCCVLLHSHYEIHSKEKQIFHLLCWLNIAGLSNVLLFMDVGLCDRWSADSRKYFVASNKICK